MNCKIGGGESHLNVAAHDFQGFTRPHPIRNIEFRKITPNRSRGGKATQRRNRLHPRSAFQQTLPEDLATDPYRTDYAQSGDDDLIVRVH
ncbi:hypothetical protein JCM17478_01770 [Thermopirellula anaerolimosa]